MYKKATAPAKGAKTIKTKTGGPSPEERALQEFTDLMIKRIETISKDWKKPWFTGGAGSEPCNLDGGQYHGFNPIMLILHCMDKGYKLPVFVTWPRVQKLNEDKDLPAVMIGKGEKSFPVMFFKFICLNVKTKGTIPYEDYVKLSKEERADYSVFPRATVYRVFNVEQTNMKEARPELWAKLEARHTGTGKKKDGPALTEFAPMDIMIRDERWICPITPKYQDKAYFSIDRNVIVVPVKDQFKTGEDFYGTLWHEMAHSTGAKGQLDRIKSTSFGSNDYAREELVAELSSALVATKYGMEKALEEGNAKYLKSWLGALRESPKFIKTVLADARKAAGMITDSVDAIAGELDGKGKKTTATV